MTSAHFSSNFTECFLNCSHFPTFDPTGLIDNLVNIGPGNGLLAMRPQCVIYKSIIHMIPPHMRINVMPVYVSLGN